MLYIINESVKFDATKRTLVNLELPEVEISLTNAPSLVLETLVINSQKVMPRELLFSKIWGDNSLNMSNASLNNHISELRKALHAVKLDDIIVTLPKVGFKLNAEINKQAITGKPTMAKKYKLKYFAIFNAIFLIAVLVLFFFQKEIYTKKTNHHLVHFLYTTNLCDFYYIGDDRPEDIKLNSIKEHLASIAAQCSSQRKDIYYSTGREFNEVFKIELISICGKDSLSKYTNCNNISRVM